MNVLYWGRIRGRSPVEEDLIHYLSQDHHGFQRFVQVMSLVETGDFYSLRKAGIINRIEGDHPGEPHVIHIDLGETHLSLIFGMITPIDALVWHVCVNESGGLVQPELEIAIKRANEYWEK